MGLGRLELPTSPLSGVRSSHLSYRPSIGTAWWSWSGSNRRPPECKSGALPAELQPPETGSQGHRPARQAFTALARAGLIQNQSRPIGRCRPASSRTSQTTHLNSSRDSGIRTGPERLPLTRTLFGNMLSATPATFSLRKEVIQPHLPIRLPCYDFTPIMNHTLGRCLPCGSACRLLVQFTFVM